MKKAIATSIFAAAALVAGCSSNPTTTAESPTSAAAPTQEASPTKDASPSEDASPSGDRADEFADPPAIGNDFPQLNASRLVTDVRAGDHDGFARLVIEFGDDDRKDSPVGYSVEYVDEAVSEGKGDPIEVDGDKTIDIHLSGLKIPAESDPQPFGKIDGTSTLKQIESIGPFEGMSQIVVGLDSPGPVRVSELKDPYRIVIDVKTK